MGNLARKIIGVLTYSLVGQTGGVPLGIGGGGILSLRFNILRVMRNNYIIFRSLSGGECASSCKWTYDECNPPMHRIHALQYLTTAIFVPPYTASMQHNRGLLLPYDHIQYSTLAVPILIYSNLLKIISSISTKSSNTIENNHLYKSMSYEKHSRADTFSICLKINCLNMKKPHKMRGKNQQLTSIQGLKLHFGQF